jgi:two-component system, cell cycle sensor histidine kinase and response regulator CckA
MQPDEKNPSIKHLAHDLNNIFTRILNSIELLKRKVPPSDETISLLNNIEAGTYLASEIIEDAIADTNRGNLTRRVNINSIINDVVRSFNLQLKNKIKFVLELDPKIKLIGGKYSELYRVILNLVTNSVEAITDNGAILITTKNINDGDGRIVLEICDTGVGIEEEIIAKIFDEHFTTKSTHKISGIGLSVVNKIITDLNGHIEVKSIPCKETVFTITFPSAASKTSETTEGVKSIIVAEDEDILRELLTELLQSYSYEVSTASNGKEVLELIDSSHFDLLIIDRKMPIMDGLNCIHELRKCNNTIPIILASGSHTEDHEIQSTLQIEKILNKPYSFEEMLSVIRELIS